MSATEEAVAKVRRDLGDFGQPFVDTFLGEGTTGQYDLTETNISAYALTSTAAGVSAVLVEGTDFNIDKVNGTLYLLGALNPLPVGTTLVLSGKTYGMFSDEELAEYVNDAFIQHAAGRSVTHRYRSTDGFIRYLLLRTDDGGGATVTVCRDKAGIEQSIETARQWVSANASHIQAPPPRVIRGPVIAQVAAEAQEATAAVPLPTVS